MIFKFFVFFVALFSGLLTQDCFAINYGRAETIGKIDLVSAYKKMLIGNKKIQSMASDLNVGMDEKNISRAILLPKIFIEYFDGFKNGSYANKKNDIGFSNNRLGLAGGKNNEWHVKLSIEQVLFDYSDFNRHEIGVAKSEYAHIKYEMGVNGKKLDLICAYFNAALARSKVALAQHQLDLYEKILINGERLLRHGEGTKIDILETREKIGITKSDIIGYKSELADWLRELSVLLGESIYYDQIMDIDFDAIDLLAPNHAIKKIIADSLERNLELQAARLSLRLSDIVIEREKGNFMPRVSIYASHEIMGSRAGGSTGREYKNDAIGLQVAVPIFSGGSGYYSLRQGYNNRNKVRYDLENSVQSVIGFIGKYHQICKDSVDRYHISVQNIKNSSVLVDSLRKGVAGGERNNKDILDAEHHLYQARHDLLVILNEWFQAYAKLKFYSGSISDDDLSILNKQLVYAGKIP